VLWEQVTPLLHDGHTSLHMHLFLTYPYPWKDIGRQRPVRFSTPDRYTRALNVSPDLENKLPTLPFASATTSATYSSFQRWLKRHCWHSLQSKHLGLPNPVNHYRNHSYSFPSLGPKRPRGGDQRNRLCELMSREFSMPNLRP
jgi:hypothetical protein